MYHRINIRGSSVIVRDGDGAIIPDDVSNADYAAFLTSGAVVEDVAVLPTVAEVRAEASRRMQLLVGARNADHLQIVIANASREAIRLLRIKTARPWTDDEAARAAALEAADAAIEAIRAASNTIEAMDQVPVDFATLAVWPPLPAMAARPRVTWAQLMKALALHGVLATPDVLDAIQNGRLAGALEVIFDEAPHTVPSDTLERTSPLLGLVAAGLGLSDADVAAVWAVAESVSAEAA